MSDLHTKNSKNHLSNAVQVSSTPNPNTFKFLLQHKVSPGNPNTFVCVDECKDSTLARKILELEDVKEVFFGDDFISVYLSDLHNWTVIKSQIVLTIVDHLQLGLKIYDRQDSNTNQNDKDECFDQSVDLKIKQVLEDYIKPAIAMDGGGLTYHGFEDGIVTISLLGACKGCPQSTFTLKQGIKATLIYHIPEVIDVKTLDSDK